MGEKDETERTLMAYDDVFADIMNVFLFEGERLIDPEDLEDVPSRETYVADGSVRGLDRDVAKRWTSGNLRIACMGLENQTAVDDDMPLRIMGYEGSEYRTQLREENKPNPRYPVVSVVLYLGYKKRWYGRRTLHEALKLDEGDPLAPYVTDLSLNLLEVAWLEDEQVEMFQSDFRVVADYLVKRRKFGDKYVPSTRELDHVEAVVELMGALTGDSRYKDALEEARARGREVTTMDALIDSVLERGKAEGIEKGEAKKQREIVLNMVEKGGVTVAWIAEVSGLTVDEVLDIAREAGVSPSPR